MLSTLNFVYQFTLGIACLCLSNHIRRPPVVITIHVEACFRHMEIILQVMQVMNQQLFLNVVQTWAYL